MKTYAWIDSNNTVDNIIVWDGETQFILPDGHQLVELAEFSPVQIGDIYENGQFTLVPPQVVNPNIDQDLNLQIQNLIEQ